MKTLRRLALASAGQLPVQSLLIAQYDGSDDAAGCAACGACGAGIGVIIFIFVAILAINIALLVWVARDAKARGMDSSVLWMILVMVTGPIGLIIYLYSRPKGVLVACPSCGNKRMEASAQCPHCGNA
ncbi:MAG TPA: hypothetical protein VFH11_11045 [Gemmatimonadota bacterium]|nr:hypothetical protein [Gemmatimonadota bacterium]